MEEHERMERLGPYHYYRDPSFPLGRDSLELGAFAAVKPGWRVCDLGCGGGVLLLLLSARAGGLTCRGGVGGGRGPGRPGQSGAQRPGGGDPRRGSAGERFPPGSGTW